MKHKNINSSIMNKRKILFFIMLLAIIIETVFIVLIKIEQNQFDDWFNKWTQEDSIVYPYFGPVLSNVWLYYQLFLMLPIIIMTIFIGIDTFSIKLINQKRQGFVIAILPMASILIIIDIFLVITFKLPKYTGDSEVIIALNNEIKNSYSNFYILSNRWIILLSVATIILISSIIQLYLIGLIKISKKNEIIHSPESTKKSAEKITEDNIW